MAISDYIGDKQDFFNYKYNGDDYLFCATFTALDKSGNTLVLKANAFRYIEIVDNIYHPFHTAEIIVKNDMNFFDKEYTYLGNGRDLLILTILPAANHEVQLPHTNNEFILKFEFVIVECTDINYENAICKKLKLVEAKEYKLSETFFDIVGVQNSIGGFSYLSTNTANAKPTGSWIKSILKSVYTEMNDNLFIKDQDGNEFFEQSNCININMTPHGAIPNLAIINYIMQYHLHNDSPCILKYDRVEKKFYLISYNTLFKNNELFCKDELHFGRQSTEEEQEYVISNINYTHFSKKWGILLGQAGSNSQIIEFYREAPDASLVLNFFTKEGIASYSRSHGSFLYNTSALSPEHIIEKYNKSFVEPFKNLFNNYKLSQNFHMPQSTGHMQNAWKTVTSSLPPEMNEKQFEIRKLTNLLNLNYTYMFKCRGSANRKTGTFVDVLKFDQIKNESENFDLNNLGRHLVTTVKHIFAENSYFNKIETIKPYKLLSKENDSKLDTIENLLKS